MERSQTDRHADKHTDRETDRQKKVSITDQIQTDHFSHKYRSIFSIVSKNTDQDYFLWRLTERTNRRHSNNIKKNPFAIIEISQERLHNLKLA